MSKKFAVILSGSGYLDGSEIRESVLTLLSLDTEGIEYEIFAPNKQQHHVIDHLQGTPNGNLQRNILEESARIARGKITDLKDLDSSQFDALVIPGGFGVAKNLCDFAFHGSAATVEEDTLDIVKDFKASKKPIGAFCIAPALIALCIQNTELTMTIGNDEQTITELTKLGVKHQVCKAHDCVTDKENKIVTTPAYMYDDAKLNDIFTGIHKAVKNIVALA